MAVNNRYPYGCHAIDEGFMKVSSSWLGVFIGFALVFQAAHAERGVDSSGGGNAVVCFDSAAIANRLRQERLAGSGFIDDSDISHITSVELLVVHKARVPTIPMGESEPVVHTLIEARPGETPAQYSERLKKRFSVIFPIINQIVKAGQSKFKSIKPYAHGLGAIDDVKSIENINTATCVRATIIGQFYEPSGNFIAYDSRIFALPTEIFPVSDKALSYWHEYIYAQTRYASRATSSDSAQTLVGALVTEGITLKELESLVEATFSGSSMWGDYAHRFVQNVHSDLMSKKLENASYTAGLYSVKGKKRLFESDESAKARIEEEAKADPRYQSIPQAALQLYVESWRPALYSLPQVPHELLAKLDNAVLEGMKNPTIYQYCRVYGDDVECGMHVDFNFSIHESNIPELYNLVLPAGKDL